MVLRKNNGDTGENKLKYNISNICNCEYKYFLRKANVVGICCGYKIKEGFYTNQLCIQVFVSKKIPKNQLNSYDMIPLIYKGIPTDVKETGHFKACYLIERKRPVLGGYSISTSMNDQISGTAGCVVTNGVNKFILGTNHVLANSNVLPIKTPIIQPAYIYDGYTPRDTIASLYKYIPLRFIKGEEHPLNLTDCALGLLTKSDIMSDKIAFIGKLRSVKSPKLGGHVKKVGAISELTEGTITGISGSILVSYLDGRRALFMDQILTTRMSGNGDSGSILVDNNNCAIGLLISSNSNISIFNRLSTVLEQLDVKLLK
ncbi:hypothetical protein G8S49_11455 [Clostridium botulinum C]|uniref:Nal1 N-terminal domain-containing protein n=2 Tax=Clostridium botulinum TaxID=1491 RepID=A0A9Q4XYY4_CLOBO|nr:hypothetical protein [Clostridium botulinum]MCD3195770.1 hypothetical protein [Clostridium botulinum C]MCD3201186.1 hypothetical protein [Clostridium botulinum C]MCD3206511.1 hypothetical protein [Clostridium botulinum C]MCD3209142.1 hypothetical protein [Clostridium botulinum C]MCD3226329.1 hypothetical protein [Clostridium botulinum C]